MKRCILFCCILTMLIAMAATTGAAVVTFDDLTGSGLVQDSYGGIVWESQWWYAPSSGAPYTAASGQHYAYSSPYNLTPTFSFSASEVFQGAYFSGGALAGQPVSVQFVMYYNGKQVASSGNLAINSVSTWLPSGYSGLVNEVQVLASAAKYGSIGGGLYAMDNVTYEAQTTTGGSVPAPPTIFLLLFGLAGLAGARKKFSRTASRIIDRGRL
jgi:hypothetical protein